jgi:hypothetical protein
MTLWFYSRTASCSVFFLVHEVVGSAIEVAERDRLAHIKLKRAENFHRLTHTVAHLMRELPHAEWTVR